MSTGQYQGYSVDKPTSKVMAPPGGRSSNIFGTNEDERKPQSQIDAAAFKKQQTAGNNLFGTYEEEKKPVATHAAPTNHGANGTNGSANGSANNGVSPSKQPQSQIDAAAFKKQQTAGNNLFGPNDNAVNANANRKKRTGYNPITGESYDDEPTPAASTTKNGTPTAPASSNTTPQAQNETPTDGKPLHNANHTSITVKQPPGGRSTKLW